MDYKQIAEMGGLLAALTFWHFVADWGFQSHATAMIKHSDKKVRAIHCLIYTVLMLPALFLIGLNWMEIVISAAVLFVSHFIGDSYKPVFYWAKYIRKPAEMQARANEQTFIQFASTPLGRVLVITIDQVFHIAFLFVPALLAVY